jgi:hypothetical protein
LNESRKPNDFNIFMGAKCGGYTATVKTFGEKLSAGCLFAG